MSIVSLLPRYAVPDIHNCSFSHSCVCCELVRTNERSDGCSQLRQRSPCTSTFKILSVNVRHTMKGKSDVRKLAKLIKSTQAEIVAVQQIERPQEGQSDFDAVQELAKQTEMYDFFGKARYFEGFDSGNALFSMYTRETNRRSASAGRRRESSPLAYVRNG